MNEASKLGDRIGVMNEGRLVQCDTPEKIRTEPKTDFVRAFLTKHKEHSKNNVFKRLLMLVTTNNQLHKRECPSM